MKSSEMKITVSRRPDGVPEFTFPKEWDFDKIFEQISELCCTLSEELAQENLHGEEAEYFFRTTD